MKGSGKLLKAAAVIRMACLPCTASHKAPPGSFVKWTVHSLTLKSCRKQTMLSAEPSEGISSALGSISSTADKSCCKNFDDGRRTESGTKSTKLVLMKDSGFRSSTEELRLTFNETTCRCCRLEEAFTWNWRGG